MARPGGWRLALVLAQALLVGLGLAASQSCAEARAVSADGGRIDQVRLGFGLGLAGTVSPGCAASSFAQRDPIHLSGQVTGATEGSVVSVSVRDVVTDRIAWSAERPVPPGRSDQTFALGKGIVNGRYRAELSLGDGAPIAREFVVHDRRDGVR